MGKTRKRKRAHRSEEEIREKIRRLECKLRNRFEESDRLSETPTSEISSGESHLGEHYNDIPERDTDIVIEDEPSPTIPSVCVTSAQNPCTQSAPNTNGQTESTSLAVPEEILAILGEAKKAEQELGSKIPEEISERWGKILQDGLAKEQKEALIKNMLIPENFLLIQAPKLNPEVAAILTESAKNRDKRLEKATSQLGSGIAGLVNLTKDLITSDNMDKITIIKRVSEVSQILLDLHYESTINRRKLIIPLLDKKFYTTIQGIKRDAFLFGEKLGDSIKNTKEIEKSGQHIKKPQPTPQNKPATSGNFRVPLRQQNTKNPVATPRYYNGQPAAAPRRNINATQPRPRVAPANSPASAPGQRSRQTDRRRR